MRQAVASVPGVVAVDSARARWSGHLLQGEIVARVDPALTVGQTERITREVESAAREVTPHLAEMLVTLRPAGDG